MSEEGPSIDFNDPGVQIRAVLAACIAQEVQAGRTREEAVEICHQRLKEQLQAGEEDKTA